MRKILSALALITVALVGSPAFAAADSGNVNFGQCHKLVHELGGSPSAMAPGQTGTGPLTINKNNTNTPAGQFVDWGGCAKA